MAEHQQLGSFEHITADQHLACVPVMQSWVSGNSGSRIAAFLLALPIPGQVTATLTQNLPSLPDGYVQTTPSESVIVFTLPVVSGSACAVSRVSCRGVRPLGGVLS